jgi:hypothetical protein
MSIWKDGKPLFAGDKYADLSDEALWFIGGILKHAKTLNAFTNPSTNSYKRLIPGFEAPVLRAYSARNRSGCVRIPWTESPKAKRVEARFPDPSANPYLCFAALLMAGLDGIENKIHPGEPSDKDLYDLPPEELAGIPTVCASLREALEELEKDHDFLLKGDVFTKDQIEGYMELKWEESTSSSTPPTRSSTACTTAADRRLSRDTGRGPEGPRLFRWGGSSQLRPPNLAKRTSASRASACPLDGASDRHSARFIPAKSSQHAFGAPGRQSASPSGRRRPLSLGPMARQWTTARPASPARTGRNSSDKPLQVRRRSGWSPSKP